MHNKLPWTWQRILVLAVASFASLAVIAGIGIFLLSLSLLNDTSAHFDGLSTDENMSSGEGYFGIFGLFIGGVTSAIGLVLAVIFWTIYYFIRRKLVRQQAVLNIESQSPKGPVFS
jgi:ABC-type phosphate transport system permease subunit